MRASRISDARRRPIDGTSRAGGTRVERSYGIVSRATMSRPRIAEAAELMSRFAERTRIGTNGSKRYLWTDAFAVCNYLGLEQATGDARHRETALRLIDDVHRTLGRHRADEARAGWLSGLSDEEFAAHPTRGGLRIGKPLPERAPDEVIDERLEWDRDGQYFHYLTKWMQALDRAARLTGRTTIGSWAKELAATAHRAFAYTARDGSRRMYWKMSIDLSRPLVGSMGQHDALEGFVTDAEIESSARETNAPADPDLADAIADFASMIEPARLVTADPLGLGGLLVDAFRAERLIDRGAAAVGPDLVRVLADAALVGFRQYVQGGELRTRADRRLAFRELGLAIGLSAVKQMKSSRPVAALARHQPVRDEIESFWLRPEHRQIALWLEHQDINDVMLATCLVPEGYLGIAPGPD
jgi:hypothetical protein